MRKIFMSVFALALFLSARADYQYMTFLTTDGVEHHISSRSLNVTISGGSLIAEAADEKIELPLADLVSMRFNSSENVAVDTLSSEMPVEVFTTDGIRLGSYGSPREAAESLPAGYYIFRNQAGEASKIAVNK